MIKRDIKRVKKAEEEMRIVNIGATAIGTSINASPEYLDNIKQNLSKVCGFEVKRQTI